MGITNGKERPPKSAILRRNEQTVIAVLVLAGIAAISIHWCCRALQRDDLIEIDRAAPLEAKFRVDINSAEWPELVQLPGIGEATARAIVAEREANGRFESLEDVNRRVYGIGPILIEQMKPYLQPIVLARQTEDVQR